MTKRRFRNVPARLQDKMESCVQDVKKQGRTKQQAIRICFNSVVRGKELEMSNSRKKRKQEASRREDLIHLGKVKEEARKLAEAPMADIEAEDLTEAEAQVALEAIADEVYLEDGKELATKPHMEMVMGMSFGGAQNWGQLAEFREAQNTSDSVRQTEFEFRKMVDNILEDGTLELDQKGEMISALAEGFPAQVDHIADSKEVEDPSLADRILAKVGIKQITKQEGDASFVASDFADVPDRAKPSTWKLRLAEGKSGNFTVAQVGRAITAMQPSGFRGQRVKIGSSKGAVTRKISGAINKIKGASNDQKRNLRERLAKVKSTGFIIEKDLEGNFRWFGWVSNKWRDRDVSAHPKGEIIAEEAHKEFVDWVYEKADERMPQLWLWHTPGTGMKNRVDWLDYSDGYLLSSGSLEAKEAEFLMGMAEKQDLAMSHGFFKVGYDSKEGVISKYRTFEESVLPREFVANEWTDFATLQEVKEMFTTERREFLVGALGEEKVAELEGITKVMAEELKELGVEFKDTEESAEKPAEEPKEEGKSVIKAEVDADEVIQKLGLPALSEYLEKQDKTIKEQQESIKALTEKVNELAKSEDEKIAEKLTPRAAKAPIWLRASESKETEVKEEDVPKGPGKEASHWISEALSPAPTADAVPR